MINEIKSLSDIEDVISEVVRAILLKNTIDRPGADEREELSISFAKDTVNLVLTAIVNNPQIMDEEVSEYTHAGTSTQH
jgi:hypothetical protein